MLALAAGYFAYLLFFAGLDTSTSASASSR